jgi:hypothetical protein
MAAKKKKNQQKKTKTVLIRRLSDELWRYFTPKNTTFSVALYFGEQKENKTTPPNYGIICITHPIIKRSLNNHPKTRPIT